MEKPHLTLRRWLRLGYIVKVGEVYIHATKMPETRHKFINLVNHFGGNVFGLQTDGDILVTKATFPPDAIPQITPSPTKGGPQPGSGPRKQDGAQRVMLQVRVTPETLRVIEGEADEMGLNVGRFLDKKFKE